MSHTKESIMEQAQAFASSWSLVGGMFDDGSIIDDANQHKAELAEMVADVVKQRDDLLAAAAELLSHKLPDGVRGGRLILEADCLNLDAIVARVKGVAA